ncbi:hypothetical protein ACTQ4K_00705 [Clostridium sporogenes]|uniref:hypothetical protein n=1 Tax=Clostridium sporogenes TaxID=1509 RepID=UPI003F912B8C
MSENELKIKVKDLEKHLEVLKKAIEDFEPYSSDFVSETRSVFEGFNSDFIDKIDDVVKHLSEDVAKDILKKSNEIYMKTKGAVDSFKEQDKETSKQIKAK